MNSSKAYSFFHNSILSYAKLKRTMSDIADPVLLIFMDKLWGNTFIKAAIKRQYGRINSHNKCSFCLFQRATITFQWNYLLQTTVGRFDKNRTRTMSTYVDAIFLDLELIPHFFVKQASTNIISTVLYDFYSKISSHFVVF